MKRKKAQIRILLVLVGIGGILVLYNLPFRDWLNPIFDMVEGEGWVGQAVFVLLGTGLTVCFVPASVFTVSAGMLFGFLTGFGLASLILVAGSIIGYGMGAAAWKRVQHWPMMQHPLFKAVQQAIGDQGYTILTLLRLTPVFHFMTGNVFYGSLNLRLVPYTVYSYLGMIPGTALTVYGGSLVRRTLEEKQNLSTLQTVLFLAGGILFVGIVIHVSKTVRGLLREFEEESNDLG